LIAFCAYERFTNVKKAQPGNTIADKYTKNNTKNEFILELFF